MSQSTSVYEEISKKIEEEYMADFKFNNMTLNYYYQIFKDIKARYTEHFAYGFNNESKQKFLVFRTHLGSKIAFCLATYNLYNIRQRIIKQAIHLTKSKNPWVVRGACFYVGLFYYAGLLLIWHIPSISTEFAFYFFMGNAYSSLDLCLSQKQKAEKLITKRTIEHVKNKYKIETDLL